MVARKPARKPRGPVNQSRGAGQAARASAAATEPMAGAFYSPDGGEPIPYTAPEVKSSPFPGSVRSGSVQIERGGSVDREVAEAMAVEAINDAELLASEIARIRKDRKPIGAYAQKLALDKRNGYHRHWFNDVAGRVHEAEASGWKKVQGKDGKPISRCVGSGRDKGALYAFAMEIPEVFWLEDQAAKQAAADNAIAGLKKNPFMAAPGSTDRSDAGKFYDPSESESGPLQIVKR